MKFRYPLPANSSIVIETSAYFELFSFFSAICNLFSLTFFHSHVAEDLTRSKLLNTNLCCIQNEEDVLANESETMTSTTIHSMNCHGLASCHTRRGVLNYLRNRNHEIKFLQDIHVDRNMANLMINERGLEGIIASYTTAARGVAVLSSNSSSTSTGDGKLSKQTDPTVGGTECENVVDGALEPLPEQSGGSASSPSPRRTEPSAAQPTKFDREQESAPTSAPKLSQASVRQWLIPATVNAAGGDGAAAQQPPGGSARDAEAEGNGAAPAPTPDPSTTADDGDPTTPRQDETPDTE